MTRRAALAALLLLAAGCVHYPTVMETGGVRIRTENGRAVRQGGDLVVTFDVVSSGKYGDTITGVVAPLAKQAVLVRGGGGALSRLEIADKTYFLASARDLTETLRSERELQEAR